MPASSRYFGILADDALVERDRRSRPDEIVARSVSVAGALLVERARAGTSRPGVFSGCAFGAAVAGRRTPRGAGSPPRARRAGPSSRSRSRVSSARENAAAPVLVVVLDDAA